jgi:aryl-alcohol dehydrogenase-like predicted oxidoreductase
MVKALGAADLRGLPRFVSTQVYYSLQERSIEQEILPACLDQGLGILVWSPLAGGLLSGKYRRGQDAPEGSRHVTEWSEPPVYDEDRLYDTIDVLVEIADGHGVSAAQVALAWLLRRPGISSVVIGARTDEQLADNLKAAELKLGDEELARLEKVSRPPLPYPLWHQANTASDRLGPADLAALGPYLDEG